MRNKQGRYLYRFFCAAILSLFALACFEFAWIEFVEENNQTGHLTGTGNILMALGLYAGVFVLFASWLHGFKIGVERITKVVTGIVLAIFSTNIAEIFLSMAITGQFRFFGDFLGIFFLLSLVQSLCMALMTAGMAVVYARVIPPLQLLEVRGGDGPENGLCAKLNALRSKYEIKSRIDYTASDETLMRELEKFDAVLINDIPAREENRIVKLCFALDKRAYLVPKLSDIIVKSSEDLNLVDTPLFLCRNLGMNFWQRVVKRLFDLFFSLLALLVFWPFFLLTAFAIRMEDGGPVFFRQERVTRDGKHFMIMKFRSMVVDAEKDGRPHPAGERDDRITKVGRVIRRFRIDELPQIFNILAGDMSIVGPRPERWEHVEKYTAEIPEFQFRLKVKGGLTGYAQVYGKYNTSALDKLKLDMIYISNYSLLLDLQILFETVKILFQKESTEGFPAG